MGTRIDVDPEVIQEAGRTWGAVAVDLDGAGSRLAKASVADLAPTVGAAARRFLDTWADEISARAHDAEQHQEDLSIAVGRYTGVDRETSERMRALLPWKHRNADIVVIRDPLQEPGA